TVLALAPHAGLEAGVAVLGRTRALDSDGAVSAGGGAEVIERHVRRLRARGCPAEQHRAGHRGGAAPARERQDREQEQRGEGPGPPRAAAAERAALHVATERDLEAPLRRP